MSQNGQTIVGAQSNFNLKYAGPQGITERPVELKSNFLRKGQGRGGSPTEYDLGFVDAATGQRYLMNQSVSSTGGKLSGGIVPIRRDNQTTIRVRTKNNSYVYGKQNLFQTNGGPDPAMENLLWHKKRAAQEKIQKYKEHKLQMQILEMERQQKELKDKVEREKSLEKERIKRNEKLKMKIGKYQEEKMKKEQDTKKKQEDEAE